MPACDKSNPKAQDRIRFKCNPTTGRYNKKTEDDLVADVVKCKSKVENKRLLLKTQRSELKTLKKVQKMYHQLAQDNARLKLNVEILQTHIKKINDSADAKLNAKTKRAQSKKKKPTMTVLEMNQKMKENAAKQTSRMDEVCRRAEEMFKLQNPDIAIPVDFQAEAKQLSKQLPSATKRTVHILIPRKKIKA
jgi:hypothetical protein